MKKKQFDVVVYRTDSGAVVAIPFYGEKEHCKATAKGILKMVNHLRDVFVAPRGQYKIGDTV